MGNLLIYLLFKITRFCREIRFRMQGLRNMDLGLWSPNFTIREVFGLHGHRRSWQHGQGASICVFILTYQKWVAARVALLSELSWADIHEQLSEHSLVQDTAKGCLNYMYGLSCALWRIDWNSSRISRALNSFQLRNCLKFCFSSTGKSMLWLMDCHVGHFTVWCANLQCFWWDESDIIPANVSLSCFE